MHGEHVLLTLFNDNNELCQTIKATLANERNWHQKSFQSMVRGPEKYDYSIVLYGIVILKSPHKHWTQTVFR